MTSITVIKQVSIKTNNEPIIFTQLYEEYNNNQFEKII